MEAFEQLVSEILWMEGFWVRTSVKVDLTKEEKRRIGLPSTPRWELDIVAYSGRDNLLKVVECKSFLDSRGVTLRAFDGSHKGEADRYKMFNQPDLRKVVFERLSQQVAERGSCPPNAGVTLCLACGKIASDEDRAGLREHFSKQGWELFDEIWVRKKLRWMANQGYENQISSVVAKILLRGKGSVAVE